jgi:excisionase family DNA binding protein
VARTLERKLEEALAAAERERGKLAALEQARPEPLTDAERDALSGLARDLPCLWNAKSTTDRDRKQLLRAVISEIVVTVHAQQRQAIVEIAWEGGAKVELSIRLNARGPDRYRLGEDTIELIRRLAEHHPDRQIAQILSLQGRRTGTGLPFTETRVKAARQRAGIPAAPPPDPDSELLTIQQAARELNVSTFTIRRWLRDGLLPGEQTTPRRSLADPSQRRDTRTLRARRVRAARRGRKTARLRTRLGLREPSEPQTALQCAPLRRLDLDLKQIGEESCVAGLCLLGLLERGGECLSDPSRGEWETSIDCLVGCMRWSTLFDGHRISMVRINRTRWRV